MTIKSLDVHKMLSKIAKHDLDTMLKDHPHGLYPDTINTIMLINRMIEIMGKPLSKAREAAIGQIASELNGVRRGK